MYIPESSTSTCSLLPWFLRRRISINHCSVYFTALFELNILLVGLQAGLLWKLSLIF